jgi:hypothetical protein
LTLAFLWKDLAMHRVLLALTLVVCLALALAAPRGLVLALIAAAAGLAHHAYVRRRESGRLEE